MFSGISLCNKTIMQLNYHPWLQSGNIQCVIQRANLQTFRASLIHKNTIKFLFHCLLDIRINNF